MANEAAPVKKYLNYWVGGRKLGWDYEVPAVAEAYFTANGVGYCRDVEDTLAIHYTIWKVRRARQSRA